MYDFPKAGSSRPNARQAASASTAQISGGHRADVLTSLRPLVLDVGVPLAAFYLLRDGFGVSLWLSLALSSIPPAIRAVAGLAAERRANLLALLMLAVNLAGIGVSFLTGDPRAMIAKDSLVSSVIAIAILASVAVRRPLISAGLKPFMTQGKPERTTAWDHLAATSGRFRRLELAFSTTWGVALLGECAARLLGAYTLPVTTMVWLGTVLTFGAIALAVMISGGAHPEDDRRRDRGARTRPGRRGSESGPAAVHGDHSPVDPAADALLWPVFRVPTRVSARPARSIAMLRDAAAVTRGH